LGISFSGTATTLAWLWWGVIDYSWFKQLWKVKFSNNRKFVAGCRVGQIPIALP
jgi:hypothetical protein